jgi:TRAP-type mannitol/chloroaromatic compound transport system permease large subunit
MITEIALISPPDGVVMYVLQGMRPRGGSIMDVYAGVMPFFIIYIVGVFIMLAFPGLALWLPHLMNY